MSALNDVVPKVSWRAGVAVLGLFFSCAGAQDVNPILVDQEAQKKLAVSSETDTVLTEELISVRALMRMEMALALAQARKKSAHLENQTSESGQRSRLELPISELRLTAIYGTGSKLVAEVRAGSRTLTYINGKTWPVGVTSGETAYRLVSMKGRCLTLVRLEQTERVCMNADSAGAR